ncbi:RNA polymerase sigma-70 factor (ECF subfamily) [Pedobacter cryoconitis]|uniref:RNA polymerase sigma factor n=1 Tax=Pedobacter cryoconitis TaxID=188932 RepID=UPI00161C90FA|nr:RNA polymerase sigma factor [Pedobacter cryoconitis]MBB6270592.1 RNA polymerase sigma-70 factor (ECF subfamily) [Pedobacter cryoconitis]
MISNSFPYQINDHKSALKTFALNFTKNIDDADDLVQETLLKAIRYSKLYVEGTNLKGWLYTIMRNTFINDYRRMVKQRSLIDTTEEINSAQLYNSASHNQVNNKFISDDVNKALSMLSVEYYTPFIKYFEGYKYHEIAEMLNIPIGTVKTRIHVARQLLKSNLKIYNQEFKKTNKFN